MSSPYDEQEFFDQYLQFARQRLGLAGAPEWPTMEALLPAMERVAVLDLGCGLGWFAAWAIEQGAASVDAVDNSERMLSEARVRHGLHRITYHRADLDTDELPAGPFDVAFSSLALHYVADFAGLAARIAAVLRPGGTLVFSVEHPIFTAPTTVGSTQLDGREVWPLDRYADEGERVRSWLVDGVRKHHRTVATHVNTLIGAGFQIDHMCEYGPEEALVAETPTLQIDRDRPAFLIMRATRVDP